MDWAITEFRAYMLIKARAPSTGSPSPVYLVDLVRFSCDFELNGIPAAVASVAVGDRADEMHQYSAIHILTDQLKMMLPVSVYLEAKTYPGPQSEAEAWPRGPIGNAVPFRIFRGYITGTGFRRGPTSAEYTVHMVHWLADMNFSSSVARSSHPMNPGQMSYNAAFLDLSAGTAAMDPSKIFMTADSMASGFIQPDVVERDFWANLDGTKGLKAWLEKLCENDKILHTHAIQSIPGMTPPLKNNQNWEALRALQHFEPNASYTLGSDTDNPQTVTESGYVDGVPMDMELSDPTRIINIFLANSISQDIAGETYSTSASFTLWDKLVGQLAPLYLFAVVPMVEKALIVPYCPGLRWDEAPGSRYFSTKDYDHFEVNSFIPRPLRGVLLMTSLPSNTGADVSGNAPPQYAGFGPSYISKDPNNLGGLYLFKEAPRWMTDVTSPWNYFPMNPPFGNAHFPGVGVPSTLPTPAQVQSNIRPLQDSYAQALYLQEITKGRQGVLSGRLRFDTAPGTLVAIQMQDAVSRWDGLPFIDGEYLYGMVLRVSCTIDAEAGKAGTSFQIGFLTDKSEQQSDDTSTLRHPIWGSNFFGAPLVVMGGEPVEDPFRHQESPAMPPSETEVD